jgi:DNA-binding LacI/PurR family transcriptional regulator
MYGYIMAEIARHLGVHWMTVSRVINQTEDRRDDQ